MGSPRGLLKKIRTHRSVMRPIRLRRKKSEAVATGSNSQVNMDDDDDDNGDQAWVYQVTSTPKACPYNPPQGYFDWLTNKVNELSDNRGNADETDTVYPSDYGWAWLSSCWGPSSMVDKIDDTTDCTSATDESSYDSSNGTGESSVPSMSRLDQVLKLPVTADDEVSDITSVPSIDTCSDSESEDMS